MPFIKVLIGKKSLTYDRIPGTNKIKCTGCLYLNRHVRTQNNIYWLADSPCATTWYQRLSMVCYQWDNNWNQFLFEYNKFRNIKQTNSHTTCWKFKWWGKEHRFLQKMVQQSTKPTIQVSKFTATIRLCSTPRSIVNKYMLVGNSDSCCTCLSVCVNLQYVSSVI